MSAVAPVPDGFHTITPHLVLERGKEALAFYQRAFGAQQLWCHTMPGGDKVVSACLLVGDTPFMLNDAVPEHGVTGPGASTPVTLHLYVEDADAWWQRAVDAGCEVVMPLADQFWGDRYGMVRDPFGHQWSIASRVEEVGDQELAARQQQAFPGGRIVMRAILAVLAGMVTWAVIVQGTAAALTAAMPEAFDANGVPHAAGLLVLFLVLSVVASVAAGWVTAALAPALRMKPVVALALIQLALGLFFQLSTWQAMPLWYHLPFLALLVPGNLLGGWWSLGRADARSALDARGSSA